jgi:hypothetical protein
VHHALDDIPINATTNDLLKRGRFNLRLLAEELGVFVDEEAKSSFMQLDNQGQAEVVRNALLKSRGLPPVEPVDMRQKVSNAVLARVTKMRADSSDTWHLYKTQQKVESVRGELVRQYEAQLNALRIENYGGIELRDRALLQLRTESNTTWEELNLERVRHKKTSVELVQANALLSELRARIRQLELQVQKRERASKRKKKPARRK